MIHCGSYGDVMPAGIMRGIHGGGGGGDDDWAFRMMMVLVVAIMPW